MFEENVLNETKVSVSQSLKERNYWLSKLSDDIPRSSFAYDNNNTLCNEKKFNEIRFEFSKEIDSKLISISNGSDLRLHMILIAGVMALLNKYSDLEDTLIGTTIYNQDLEKEFINTILPLRTNVKSNMSFKELIIDVKKLVTEAIDNQNCSIKKLLENLHDVQTQEELSLFDVVVLLENVQDNNYIGKTDSNIRFVFNRKDNSFENRLIYNELLYSVKSIEKIVSRLNILFSEVLQDVNLKIENIDIVSRNEKQQLLVNFNTTDTNYNTYDTLYELFEEQALKTPNNIAVVYGNYQLTYRELNEKANMLAKVLVNRGVKTESLVGIMIEPSVEIIVGILAIIKSGGAYVPIDAEYPKNRIEYMIKNSNINVMLTKFDIQNIFNFQGEVILLCDETEKGENIDNLGKISNGDNAAYVIYTSGSTGEPKGVVVEHKSIANSILWRKKKFNFSSETTLLQTSSFSFDTSVLSVFTPLVSGAKLVLIKQNDLLNGEQIKDVVIKNKVTDFSLVPNIYKLLLATDWQFLKDVKTITLVGESFNKELVKEHFNKLKNVRLFNEYGPAENSVCSTLHEFKNEESEILIGKPIDNVKCYVLDKNNKLLPIGIEGELFLSGEGLARGYLNNEILTKKKFINFPFMQEKRMYKTGDYVKWHDDGNLEFIGRKDDLVKINGCRIEIGEIEKEILKNEKIKEAIVIEKTSENRNNFLCAYIVLKEDEDALKDKDLRTYLDGKIPKYMIPSFFIPLKTIPRTLSGKIDKKKLLDPTSRIEEIVYVAPRNDTEKTLCEIYSSTLKVDKVGITDNFFHIGGDSIKSIALISVINEKLKANLEVSNIYENQTIEELAKIIVDYKDSFVSKEIEYDAILKEMDELKDLIMKGE